MQKYIKFKTVEVIKKYRVNSYGGLSKFIGILNEKLNSVPEEYRKDVCYEISYDIKYDYTITYFKAYYTRPISKKEEEVYNHKILKDK